MKAVILAAGVGSRLGSLTKDKPKCMLRIKNYSLIEYQIEKLKDIGVKEKNIFIIAGYKIEKLKKHLKDRNVNIIFNNKYKEWNNIYSFYLINEIPAIKKDDVFLLLNSDSYFHKYILKKLVKFSKNNLLMVDTYKKLGFEEMKVIVQNDKVIKLGKDLPVKEAVGEYIGLAKFRKKEIQLLFNVMRNLLNQGKTDLWYELAFNKILNKIAIFYIDTENFPWIEIDTLNDFEEAKLLNIDL